MSEHESPVEKTQSTLHSHRSNSSSSTPKHVHRKRPGAPTLLLNGNSDAESSEFLPRNVLNIDAITKDSKFQFEKTDLVFQVLLGSGSSGSVSRVLHVPSQETMACKVIKGAILDREEEKKARNLIMRELKILRLCRSTSVVSFFGAFLHDQDIYIMMEYMDLGSLETIYKATGPIPEPIVGVIGLRVLQGLKYLYLNHKIVHRDIKPSNILMSSTGDVKIADFGVSKQLTDNTQAMTFTGTQAYLAPERIRQGSNCSPVADVWGVGLTLIEIATGKFPIPEEAMSSIMDLLGFIDDEASRTMLSETFSPEFSTFITMCLRKDPNSRATPEQLFSSAFMIKAAENPDEIFQWSKDVGVMITAKMVETLQV